MDTIRIMVTLVSLGMAITMSVIAWNLLRQERRRTTARIAALAAEAQRIESRTRERERAAVPAAHVEAPANAIEPSPAEPVRAHARSHGWPPAPSRGDGPAAASIAQDKGRRREPSPRDVEHVGEPKGRSHLPDHGAKHQASVASLVEAAGVDVYIHPDQPHEEPLDRRRVEPLDCARHGRRQSPDSGTGAGMFSSAAASTSQRRIPLAAVIGVMTVVLLGGTLLVVNQTVRSASDPTSVESPTGAPLELVSLRHLREGDRLSVDGRVRNPTRGGRLSQVDAVVFLFDRNGTYITTGRAPIEIRALAPGEESAFTVALPNAGSVGRYRVSFRSDGDSVVPHVDRREATTLAAGM
jgi:type II secretory pathway pseudopilin PulG